MTGTYALVSSVSRYLWNTYYMGSTGIGPGKIQKMRIRRVLYIVVEIRLGH